MSGFFKRKKQKNDGSEDDENDRYLDLIATKVKDSDGEFFGEIALFGDTVRTATVRAVTYCDVYVLSERSFRYLARKYPEVRSQVETKARARAARTRDSTPQS